MSPLKRYFLKLSVMLLAVTLPFAAFFAGVQSLPAQFGGSIMSTLPHKIELAQQEGEPRVILAGGSSSPYATNCALLSQLTGRPCINVGVTAYLGIEYYLSLLEHTMRPGDVIVLAPEHSMLAGQVDYLAVWMAVENDAQALKMLPASYWPGMFSAYERYAALKLEKNQSAAGSPPALYHNDFGPLGDVVAPRELILESGYNREDPIALSEDTLDPQVLRHCNRFAQKAEKQGVTVLFAFAPVNALAVTTPAESWDALESELRGGLQMPVLGSQRQAVLDAQLFYDSNNHLNTIGAEQYSRRLAELLTEYL